MSAHLSEADLTALAKGELPEDAAARLNEHLRSCPDCYAQSLRAGQSDTGDVEAETGAIVGRPNWVASASPEIAWVPGTDLGRYVILHTLGKGGMGVVFRAYDKELDRAVALKVLHQDEGEGSSGGSTRLLREAQAMARLAHPNVVAVHDVVVLQQRVCVVMELVEGVTVREWLKAEPKKQWKQVVEVFRAAAEGLAAAHDAHLVHRDFKPDNVLVGKDGRIRVTDFGIARLASDGSEAPAVPAGFSLGEHATGITTLATSGPHSLGGTLGHHITTENQLVGTPRYMAPEQFEKAPADFRTDQFSFGVSLYEALYGEYPFKGESLPAKVRAAKKGELRPPPSSANVPPWVYRIVARTLAADPQQRFASMRELGAALARDPSHLRNRWLVGGAVATALGLALVMVVNSVQARARLCTGSELKLHGIWDNARREQIRAAFVATNLPFAEDSFTRAAAVLDVYATEWATTHRDACEATRVRGEQSDRVLTLRMACLHERLDALTAMTDVFIRAEAGTVGKAKQALDALPRVATCSDVARLSAKVPPPEDPALAAEVERIRTELTRADVLHAGGRYAEGEVLADEAYAAALKTGYSPVISEAEIRLGLQTSKQIKYERSVELFTDAFTRALADGHDDVRTAAALALAEVLFRMREDARGMEWTSFAEAANQRTKSAETSAMIENARGNFARNVGDFTRAAEHYARGMEVARSKLGPDHMTTLGMSYNYGSALQNLGRYREAIAIFEPVMEAARRTLGPRHPFLAYPLASYANAAAYREDTAKHKALLEELLVVTGGKGRNADHAYDGLAEVALEEKRYEEALQLLERAIEVHESLSPGGIDTLQSVVLRGQVLVELGRPDEALATFEEVISRGGKDEGAFDSVASARLGKARILLDRGEATDALPLAIEAVDTLTPKRGKAHPDTLDARLMVADVRWKLGEKEAAVQEAKAVLADARVEFDDTHSLAVRAKSLISRGETVAIPAP